MRPFLVFVIIALCGCAQSSVDRENESQTEFSNQTTPGSTIDSDSLKAKIENEDKNKLVRLSDRNVEEYLSEFAVKNKSSKIKIKTPQGDIVVKLYKDTPMHRASFIHLIQQKYFNFVEITRVEKKHVIQGGNSQEEAKATQRFLLGKYTIPSEIKAHHIHKKGALALARHMENNDDKRSEPYDFYFVHGRKSGGAELFNIQKEKGISYSLDQIKTYKTLGGTPHLDREFTVFGEVISGLSVLDKIASLEVDKQNWPKDDLVISMEILD